MNSRKHVNQLRSRNQSQSKNQVEQTNNESRTIKSNKINKNDKNFVNSTNIFIDRIDPDERMDNPLYSMSSDYDSSSTLNSHSNYFTNISNPTQLNHLNISNLSNMTDEFNDSILSLVSDDLNESVLTIETNDGNSITLGEFSLFAIENNDAKVNKEINDQTSTNSNTIENVNDEFSPRFALEEESESNTINNTMNTNSIENGTPFNSNTSPQIENAPLNDEDDEFDNFLKRINRRMFFFEKNLYPFYYMLFYYTYGLKGTKRSIGKDSLWASENFYSSRFNQNSSQTHPDLISSTSSSTTSGSLSPFLERKSKSWNPIISFACIIIAFISSFGGIIYKLIDQWMDGLFLIIQYLQLTALILGPVSNWSKETMRWTVRLGFLRLFQLEDIFMDPIDFNHNINLQTAYFINFYLPIIMSYLYIFLLFFSIIHCYILSLKLKNKNFENYKGFKQLYLKITFGFLGFLYRLQTIVYIPILGILLLSITCDFSWRYRIELIPNTCWSLGNFPFALISLFIFVPYVIASIIGTFGLIDWRPDTGNVCGKPHFRFDMVFMIVITIILVFTHFLEMVNILILFIDFICILILLGFHIYFMQWYKLVINQFVASSLFLNMFACLIGLLVSTFHLIFLHFEYSFTDFPGTILFVMIPISIICGMKMTIIRLNVIKLSLSPLSAPRPLQLLYNIEPSDIIIPRGEFEIEMATRSLNIVKHVFGKNDVGKLPQLKRGRIHSITNDYVTIDQMLDEDAFHHEQEEKVRDMFQNALDMASHSRSDYIHIAYGTYLAHIMNDLRTAVQLSENAQTTRGILFLDVRMMYYIRQRYWNILLHYKQKQIQNPDQTTGTWDENVRHLTQLHQERVRNIEEEARRLRQSTLNNI